MRVLPFLTHIIFDGLLYRKSTICRYFQRKLSGNEKLLQCTMEPFCFNRLDHYTNRNGDVSVNNFAVADKKTTVLLCV